MNEKGLVANLLYLAESRLPQAGATGKPNLSLSTWLQYVLDNFATVAEAVDVTAARNRSACWPRRCPTASPAAPASFAISDAYW